ncbi:Protein FAM186A, partial [Camelus dromedarius]
GLNMELSDIMHNVQRILNRYTVDEHVHSGRKIFLEEHKKRRTSLLEKLAAYIKSADIKDKTLADFLAWLEEWRLAIDRAQHKRRNAISLFYGFVFFLYLLAFRGSLWKSWKERVIKRPAAAHALRPDQMISDEFATNTKVSEIQDMLQELIGTAMFNKLENNAIKYISATIRNLSKALSTLKDEVKFINLQSANMYINETSEGEKEISLKIVQDLSEKNEMLQQKLQEAEEKYEQLIQSKGVEHQALPTSTLEVLSEPSPQSSMAVSQAHIEDSIDNILSKEFKNTPDEVQRKGTKLLGIKWDSAISYIDPAEMISDLTDQQYSLPEKKQKKSSEDITEDKISEKKGGAYEKNETNQYQSQKGKHVKGPPVPKTSESSSNDDKGKHKVAGTKLDHHFELPALEEKRKEIKSFSEAKSKSSTESKSQHALADFPSTDTKSQGGKSGTSSLWERLRKAKPEYSLSKSQISSGNKEELTTESTDKEGKHKMSSLAEPFRLSQLDYSNEKLKTKGKKHQTSPGTTASKEEKTEEKDMLVSNKKVKSYELVKSQPRTTKETSDSTRALGSPDSKNEQNNIEEFQKAIMAFLKEKTDNIGKPLDKKTVPKEELLLNIAEVEKLGIIKTKMEEYFQKVAESVTKILRKYKDIKNAGQVGEKPMKQKKEVSFMPGLHFQKPISAKSEISALLSHESLDPLTYNLIQMILTEIESERDVPVASTVGRDHKEKEKQRQEEYLQEGQSKNFGTIFKHHLQEERSYETINQNLEKEGKWLPVKEGKQRQQRQIQWQEEEVWKEQQKQRMQKQTKPDEKQKQGEEEREGHQKPKQQQLEAGKQKIKEQGVLLEREKRQQMMQVQEVRHLEQESSWEREEEKQKPRRKVEDHERQSQKTAKDQTKTSEELEQFLSQISVTLPPTWKSITKDAFQLQQTKKFKRNLKKLEILEEGQHPIPITPPTFTDSSSPRVFSISGQSPTKSITLTPQQAQAIEIDLTPEETQTLGIAPTSHHFQALEETPTSKMSQGLEAAHILEQAQAVRTLLILDQILKSKTPFKLQQEQVLEASLTPEQAQVLRIPITPEQAKAEGTTVTPEQAYAQSITLTPQQAQALGVTLTPEQAQAQSITLTPQQAQALGVTLTPQQAQALGVTLTPEQAQAQSITLTPQQAQALGVTLTPQQAQAQGVTLIPQQAQAQGITLTPQHAQALGITLTPQQAQALGVTLIPEQAQAQDITLTPQEAQALGVTLTPQQAQALGVTLTPEQPQAQGITLTPQEAQTLGVTLTPEQAQAQRVTRTPQQAQALGVTLSPEQAQAQSISLTPQPAQALGVTLTPQQAQGLGVPFTLEQAQVLQVSLSPEQFGELGAPLLSDKVYDLESPHTPEQIQLLGTPFTPGQARSMGITLMSEQGLKSRPSLINEQPSRWLVGPPSGYTLGVEVFSIADKSVTASAPHIPKQSPASPAPVAEKSPIFEVSSTPLQISRSPLTQAPLAPGKSVGMRIPSDPGKLLAPQTFPSSRQTPVSQGQSTSVQLPTPVHSLISGFPPIPGQPLALEALLSSRQFLISKDSLLISQSPQISKLPVVPRQSLISGVLPTSAQIPSVWAPLSPGKPLVPGASSIPGGLLESRPLTLSEQPQVFQTPATHEQSPYLQAPFTLRQHLAPATLPGQASSLWIPPTPGSSPTLWVPSIPAKPQKDLSSSVSKKSKGRLPIISSLKSKSALVHPSAPNFKVPQAPFTTKKFPISEVSDTYKEIQIPQDPFAMEQHRTFQSCLTDYRTPVSQTPDKGELPTLMKPVTSLPSLTIQLPKTSQSSLSEWDQKTRFPPIDKSWILTSVSGTKKPKIMAPTSYPQELKEKYFVDVEAQRKNLILLSQATKASGLPSQLHTMARNLIIETLHTDAVRLRYLFRKYIAYRLIQRARNNIIKRLLAIQNTGKGYETQNLYIMLNRIDDYQEKVMQIWTEKQKSLEQKRNQCLRKMMYLFSQLQEIYKLNLSQPIPLIIDKKQIHASTKFVQRTFLELQKEEDRKYDIFKKFRYVVGALGTKGERLLLGKKNSLDMEWMLHEAKKKNLTLPSSALRFSRQEDQIEAIWNADLSTSSYPITEKTPMYSFWAQLGGFPDIPMLLQLDVQSTFRRSLACLQSK